VGGQAEALDKGTCRERKAGWTESIAIGSGEFIRDVKQKLGPKATWREIAGANGSFELRERPAAYDRIFDAPKCMFKAKNLDHLQFSLMGDRVL
jgi:hypothetical protein